MVNGIVPVVSDEGDIVSLGRAGKPDRHIGLAVLAEDSLDQAEPQHIDEKIPTAIQIAAMDLPVIEPQGRNSLAPFDDHIRIDVTQTVADFFFLAYSSIKWPVGISKRTRSPVSSRSPAGIRSVATP